MTIFYQNPQTGDTFDIAPLITSAKWATKRAGSPASLELTALADGEVLWEHGGIVAALEEEQGFFYGFVFKLSQTEKGELTVTAYDQTRYLKNKESYLFTGKRADEITAKLAADFGIATGALANTGYVIPQLVADNQTLYDTILKALDLTLINTGKLYCLWDDFGSLRITETRERRLDLFLGDESAATGYTYASDIDSETYNVIKLTRGKIGAGKREIYLIKDSAHMKLWGVLQNSEAVNENMNEAQIQARAEQMMELYNRPKRSFDMAALSDLSVRAGCAVYIGVERLGVSQFFIVEEASHDLLGKTMSLKLKIV